MIKRTGAVVFLLILFAVQASPLAANDVVDYRLPPDIAPTQQDIYLYLDPGATGFHGRTTISIRVDNAQERLGVYQSGLQFGSITLVGEDGERTLAATAGDWDISWLSDGEPIPAGDYELFIEFNGRYATDSLGMHRVTYEGRDYVFTQMEDMYARRAFPLFDEPSFKIPWQLSIEAPSGLTVVANTPVESTIESDGNQRVTFRETKPLASYLLAFAVGPLDRVPLEGLSVPGHIYTPAGRTEELGFVLRETPRIVTALEDYFGLDYPFEKLDFVAVPDFAFGAMENPGLITFRTDLLMVGDNASGSTAELVLMVIAHEVAHIWYGDLVTMEWWDDLWLNEAFASWMGRSTIERLYPQYDSRLKLPQARAFDTDQSSASKAIRRTVRNSDEVFDGVRLNYSKGSTLLRMLEAYVGHDVWQEAIRKYIKRFAWDNATEQDLWAAVSEVSGLDIAAIAGAYLNQPGFALVSIDGDGKVRQQRYVVPGNDVPDLTWQIPLSIKYKKNGEIRQSFFLLTDKAGTADLPAATEWIFPDAGGNGYYRWQIDLDRFYALVDDANSLGNRERIALLDNSEALFSVGRLSLADYLYALERLLRDPHPLVFLPALENLKTIGDEFVDEATSEAFGRFVDDTLGERLASIGLDTRRDDSEAILQMRPRLLRVLGEYGSNPEARDGAVELAKRFLSSPESIDTDLAREALRVTALHDDGSMYDDYKSAYLAAKNPVNKSAILGAVYFDNPETIVTHLDFLLTEEVQGRDSADGLSLYASVLDDNTPVFAWLDQHLSEFMAKIPAYMRGLIPQVVGGGCSQASVDRLRSLFGERDEFATSLNKAVLEAEACIDRRQRHTADLERFLGEE